MTDTTLSEAVKEAYASAPVDEIIYHTLEINHPDFTAPIRVVRDRIELVATTENAESVTFVPFAFDVVPPDVQSQQMPICKVEMDNVGRELMSQLEAAYTSNEMITMIYRQYLESDKTAPQNNPISPPKPPAWYRVARARPELLLAHAHVGRKLPPARNPPVVNPQT
jgi:hypothetical protein